MTKLAALACTGSDFYDALRRSWDQGYAIAPVDMRQSADAQLAQIERLQPDLIFNGNIPEPVLCEVQQGRSQLHPDDALVIETSGSTGQPKQVVHTHSSIAASANATSKALDVRSDDHWLACLPLNHIGGLSVVFRSYLGGNDLTITDLASPTVIISAAMHGATLVSLVTRLLNKVDASNFRKILIGGGAPPKHLASNVIPTYGLTETGSGIYYKDSLIEGAELKVIDGEILVKGPMLFRGYRTASGIDEPFADGWFKTGDVGNFKGGKLTVNGRKGFGIRTGGEDVWPQALEQVLETHPGITKAAVTSQPSNEWGQSVIAYIQLSPLSTNPLSEAEIKELVTATLPKWYVPKQLVFTDQIPMTASGKVDRAKLAE